MGCAVQEWEEVFFSLFFGGRSGRQLSDKYPSPSSASSSGWMGGRIAGRAVNRPPKNEIPKRRANHVYKQ